MEVLSQKQPISRKEHRCMWCGGTIKKGEKYDNATCKNYDIYTWKNHLKCMDLYHYLNMRDGDWGEGVDGDTFMEYVYTYLRDNMSNELYEELDLWGEDAVDMALDIITINKQTK